MMEVWCKIKSWSQFLELPNGGSSGQVFGLSVISSPPTHWSDFSCQDFTSEEEGMF